MNDVRAAMPRNWNFGDGPRADARSGGGRRKALSIRILVAMAAATAVAVTGAPGAQAADTCPNAAIRAQQHAELLPDCRAYELVSLAQKDGQAVLAGNAIVLGLTMASVDGDAAVYSSWGALVSTASGMPFSYRAGRTQDGWKTSLVSPAPVNPYPVAYGSGDLTAALWSRPSRDLRHGFIATNDYFDPTDVNGTTDLYEWAPDGVKLVTRGNGAERTTHAIEPDPRFGFPAVSDDGSQILFNHQDHLVPEDADRAAAHTFDANGGPGDPVTDLYDRADGKTYLLNQRSGGGLISRCGSQADGRTNRHMISHDNSKVIFEVPQAGMVGDPDCDVPTQIYMRVDHERTIHVSASQRTPADAMQAVSYEGASTDGNLVFFRSIERLTDDVTSGGLYRYTVSTGKLDLIIPESAFPTPVKISGDGSHIYFISNYELAPGGVFGNYNLYVWSDGAVRFIAEDPASTLAVEFFGREEQRSAVVTPDGRHLLFRSAAAITSYDTGGHTEVFLYSADDATLTCISCDPAGQRPPGSIARSDASMPQSSTDDDQIPAITADGRTAVFQTSDQLVPGDTNLRQDIYEYRDGRLYLITSGHASTDAQLLGMAAGGRDVFLTTSDGLSAADVDGDVDLYDARIGGGFPEPSVAQVPTPCVQDGCQGSAPAASSPTTAASERFAGPGNVKPSKNSADKVAVAKVATVRGATATLKVTVSGKGQIKASGTGVVSTSRAVAAAGTYRVSVRLSAGAKRTLARKGRVGVRVTVRFAPAGGAARSVRVPVTFQRSGRASSRSARRATVISMSTGRDR